MLLSLKGRRTRLTLCCSKPALPQTSRHQGHHHQRRQSHQPHQHPYIPPPRRLYLEATTHRHVRHLSARPLFFRESTTTTHELTLRDLSAISSRRTPRTSRVMSSRIRSNKSCRFDCCAMCSIPFGGRVTNQSPRVSTVNSSNESTIGSLNACLAAKGCVFFVTGDTLDSPQFRQFKRQDRVIDHFRTHIFHRPFRCDGTQGCGDMLWCVTICEQLFE